MVGTQRGAQNVPNSSQTTPAKNLFIVFLTNFKMLCSQSVGNTIFAFKQKINFHGLLSILYFQWDNVLSDLQEHVVDLCPLWA